METRGRMVEATRVKVGTTKKSPKGYSLNHHKGKESRQLSVLDSRSLPAARGRRALVPTIVRRKQHFPSWFDKPKLRCAGTPSVLPQEWTTKWPPTPTASGGQGAQADGAQVPKVF